MQGCVKRMDRFYANFVQLFFDCSICTNTSTHVTVNTLKILCLIANYLKAERHIRKFKSTEIARFSNMNILHLVARKWQ